MNKIITFFIILIAGIFLLFYTNNGSWLPFGSKSTVAKASNNIELIDIDATGAATTIVPESRNDVKAKLDGKGKVIVKKQGDTITVTMKKKWFEMPFFDKTKLTIYIPEDFNKNMKVEIDSGNLSFSGESKNNKMTLNELTIDIGSGNVHLANMNVKKLKTDGASGNLSTDSVSAGSGTFDISSGNVELKHYKGGLNADLSSGTLKAQVDQLTNKIDIDVSSGIVKLDLPQDADFTLNGDVSSGRISSSFPLSDEDSNHVKGTNGSGKYKINLDVSSGMIYIK